MYYLGIDADMLKDACINGEIEVVTAWLARSFQRRGSDIKTLNEQLGMCQAVLQALIFISSVPLVM